MYADRLANPEAMPRSPQPGATEPTPAMIDAGVSVLRASGRVAWNAADQAVRELAADTFQAMTEAEKRTEIDVTPAMVAAGVAYFARSTEGRFPDDWLLAESFVTDLYREMNISRSSSLTSQQRSKIEQNRTK